MFLLLVAALNAHQVTVIAVIVVVICLMFGYLQLVLRQYKRCPSNRILVIYGRTGTGDDFKIVHGGAAFVIPLLQDYDFLSLEPIQIGVPGLPSSDVTGFNFELPSSCSVAIATDHESMRKAATRLLGLSTDEIRRQVASVIHTEIIALADSQRARETETDQLSFATALRPALEKQLDKLGLQLMGIGPMTAPSRDQA